MHTDEVRIKELETSDQTWKVGGHHAPFLCESKLGPLECGSSIAAGMWPQQSFRCGAESVGDLSSDEGELRIAELNGPGMTTF